MPVLTYSTKYDSAVGRGLITVRYKYHLKVSIYFFFFFYNSSAQNKLSQNIIVLPLEVHDHTKPLFIFFEGRHAVLRDSKTKRLRGISTEDKNGFIGLWYTIWNVIPGEIAITIKGPHACSHFLGKIGIYGRLSQKDFTKIFRKGTLLFQKP